MRKGDAFSVGSIAKIILIVLILFIILSALNGLYAQTFKDGIKKLFGEKTEQEITHEQNTQTVKDFQALEKQIKKCQNSKDATCGCLVDLNRYKSNYKIELTDKETKLINIKNQEDSGIQMASFDIKLNCILDNNLKETPLKTINFDSKPFIIEEKWWIIKDSKYYLNEKFNLLKINSRLCWMTDRVSKDKIKTIKECQ